MTEDKFDDFDDLKRADCWAFMAFGLKNSNESLEKNFREFTLRADRMLLDNWTKDLEDKRQTSWFGEDSVRRFEEIIGILKRVIDEKEMQITDTK